MGLRINLWRTLIPMETKTTTFLVTLLIAAVPLGLLWRENASLRAQITAQSQTTPTPAPGELAKSGSRGSPRVPRTDKLAAHTNVAGMIDWLHVLEDPDPVRRAETFYTFVGNLTPETAQNVAEALEDMRNRNALSNDEWRHFFRAWGGVDGKAALDFLNATPENSAARWRNREAALTGWASRDVAGAQAWLANYVSTDRLTRGEDPFFAEDLFNAVSQCMRVTDRDGARDYLVAQAVAGHVKPAQAAAWIAGDWNDADAHGNAATLLARLPADESHQEIRSAILRQLVDEHRTKEAVELVTRFQAELDSYAVENLASHVAGDDSQKAMAWLDSLDRVAPENKTKARASVVSSWAARDPEAAGSWLLEASRRGEAAPEITASFARATVGLDPVAAIAWARTIPDEALRHETLLRMAENRAASRDTEALELLKAAGLTDREISGANLLPTVVDRIPTAQARETIARCAIVRPE
jgi:hypothetical protein